MTEEKKILSDHFASSEKISIDEQLSGLLTSPFWAYE